MAKIEDIVTIKHCGPFHGMQGEVVFIHNDGHQDGPVSVKMGPWAKYEIPYPFEKNRVIRFEHRELRVDSDWTRDNKVQLAFGPSMVHHIAELKIPFSASNPCEIAGCTMNAF